MFMALVLISVTMGKHIRLPWVDSILKFITFLFCLVNAAIVASALYLLFGQSDLLTYLTVGMFFATYLLPPAFYDPTYFSFDLFTKHFPGLSCYVACMPLYQIMFQLFAYANLHDVSWGNRVAAADADA